MHFSYTYILAWTYRSVLSGLILFLVPNEIWTVVEQLIEVPEAVKEVINPLLGSLCITILEAMNEYRKKAKDPDYIVPVEPAWMFPAKIFIGWVVGVIGLPFFALFIKAPNSFIAFLGGAAGTSALTALKSNLIKKIDDTSSTDENEK